VQIQPRKDARATVQQLLCYANHCNTSCNVSTAQDTVRIHASPWSSRSCVVTQTSSDHPRSCEPHPVCLWFALEAWPRSLSITKFYFHHGFRGERDKKRGRGAATERQIEAERDKERQREREQECVRVSERFSQKKKQMERRKREK